MPGSRFGASVVVTAVLVLAAAAIHPAHAATTASTAQTPVCPAAGNWVVIAVPDGEAASAFDRARADAEGDRSASSSSPPPSENPRLEPFGRHCIVESSGSAGKGRGGTAIGRPVSASH
jgi:hypothetical protein